MAQVINTNIASLNAQRNLSTSQSSMQTALQRLSSGLRINSAKDDAAGLSISDRMTAQINGMSQASRNANDAISLAQTAEGALSSITNNLQRIRELALQSANSTNTSTDRSSLNAEAQSLLTEIQRISSTTQFNGLNLLDGSFTSSQFQVGANANQTISVSITGATTSTLGSYGGTGAAVSATAWTTGSTIAINNISVGASAAQANVAGWTADSAAAKAAAINNVTSQTGVTAVANSNTVVGVAPTFNQKLTNGELIINGVSVGPVTAATTAVGQASNAVTAINNVTSQTGVTAAYDATTGQITLTASDGRNIQLDASSAAAVSDIKNATGLTVGTAVGTAASGAKVTIAAATAASIDTSTVTLDGVVFTFAANTVATTYSNAAVTVGVNGAASASSIGAIFASALNGVSGSGNATLISTIGTITGTNAAGVVSLTESRVGASIADSLSTASAGAATITAFTSGTDGTTGAQTTRSTLTLTSASTFTLTDQGTAGGLAAGGLSNVNPALTALSTTSIATVSGSNTAISLVDAALTQIDSIRASLGAVQNRFTSAVSALQATSENISAARSRIMDTDFATETANLTRSQILQQAGVAMLAQANAMPNSVLSLLK